MEYNDIEKTLKRYSFEEKMNIAYKHSIKLVKAYCDNNINGFLKMIFPWELETFVIFSIKSNEWKNDKFSGNRTFEKIINAIRKRNDMITLIGTKKFSTLEKVLIPLSANQFDWQKNIFLEFYRYSYYFNFLNDNIDMKQEFINKFKCKYDDFVFVSYLLWVLSCIDLNNDYFLISETYQYIYHEYKTVIDALTISREEYIQEIEKITQDPNNYVICFKPSYKYPFIEYKGNIYFPLPHLVIRASTSSLMYRLTDGNSKLNEKIGKEVYESYIYKIISDTNMFDEVLQEQTYRNQKGVELKTLDILTRKDDNYILFDSKSFSPKIDLRILSDDAYQDDLRRIAETYKQLYNHLRKYIDDELSFFENKVINKAKVFGIAVIKDDVFFDKKSIYNKAAE